MKYGSETQELLMPPIILSIGSDLAKKSPEGSISFSVLHPDEVFSTGDFIPNNAPQYDSSNLWKEHEEDGFDIYVDMLMNLPDNCSIISIKANVVNNKKVQ